MYQTVVTLVLGAVAVVEMLAVVERDSLNDLEDQGQI
jgi:hypothetical protein